VRFQGFQDGKKNIKDSKRLISYTQAVGMPCELLAAVMPSTRNKEQMINTKPLRKFPTFAIFYGTNCIGNLSTTLE
jgi:hypothetical protein